jgi:uncharacterized protein YkwD
MKGLALSAVLLISLSASCTVPEPGVESDPGTLLDAHNTYRAKHCAPPMTWSAEVAASAQKWASQCVTDHDPNSDLGENLAWGTDLSAKEAVSLWYDEVGEYNFSAPGFGPAGHFTQLVWRGSKQLGCGKAVCRGDVYWVCRYSPPGNVDTEFRANVLPACR